MAQALSSHLTAGLKSEVSIRQVPFDAPWAWLAGGWRDLWKVPRIGLGYGAAFALGAFVIAAGLTRAGLASLMLALGGGFLLIGPLAAVGLYGQGNGAVWQAGGCCACGGNSAFIFQEGRRNVASGSHTVSG